jgi:hypothetical protein
VYEGGTLEHIPRVLLACQRPESLGAAQRTSPPAHLKVIADSAGERAIRSIYNLITTQMELLAASMSSWTLDLHGQRGRVQLGNPVAPISEERLEKIVCEYRMLSREGFIAQFAVHVQNLESFYEIIMGIVKIASDYVVCAHICYCRWCCLPPLPAGLLAVPQVVGRSLDRTGQ